VDAGKIRLDEMLTIKQELIGGGSGSMQYKPTGTKFTALETATKMITISDNTATNMLIARLGWCGGFESAVPELGLTTTEIRNPLPVCQAPIPQAQGPTVMALVNRGM